MTSSLQRSSPPARCLHKTSSQQLATLLCFTRDICVQWEPVRIKCIPLRGGAAGIFFLWPEAFHLVIESLPIFTFTVLGIDQGAVQRARQVLYYWAASTSGCRKKILCMVRGPTIPSIFLQQGALSFSHIGLLRRRNRFTTSRAKPITTASTQSGKVGFFLMLRGRKAKYPKITWFSW